MAEIMTEAKLKELRDGVEETTEMTFHEFLSWWRKRPPLFDDAPLHRRMAWDENLEGAVKDAVQKELPEAAKQNEDLQSSDRYVKPVRFWMGLVVRIIMASNRPGELQKKLAGKNLAGVIDPSWNKPSPGPQRPIVPVGQFKRPPTIRERSGG